MLCVALVFLFWHQIIFGGQSVCGLWNCQLLLFLADDELRLKFKIRADQRPFENIRRSYNFADNLMNTKAVVTKLLGLLVVYSIL